MNSWHNDILALGSLIIFEDFELILKSPSVLSFSAFAIGSLLELELFIDWMIHKSVIGSCFRCFVFSVSLSLSVPVSVSVSLSFPSPPPSLQNRNKNDTIFYYVFDVGLLGLLHAPLLLCLKLQTLLSWPLQHISFCICSL